MKRPRTKSFAAFTLIELIIVITIIGILMVFTVPAITGALKANKLSQGADLLRAQLSFAQQTAMRENAPIQVRFYRYDDPAVPGVEEKFRAYQFYRRQAFNRSDKDAGSTTANEELMEPIAQVRKLPKPIIISDTERLSSIVGLQKSQGQIPWKRGDPLKADYVAFDFRADGSTNLTGSNQWFLTLVEETEDRGGQIPENFATVQVDPFTGSIRLLRPE